MTELKKKRVSKACDCCRKSKTKCDGLRPCSRCLADHKICTYTVKKKSSSVSNNSSNLLNYNYVDLLETRVSLLIQSFNQILNKCSSCDPQDIIKFSQNEQLKDEEGNFDINKVILHLVPNENLKNLEESNQLYSIDQITKVTDNSPVPKIKCEPTSPSLSSPSSPHHFSEGKHHHSCPHSLSKVIAGEQNHIHKPSLKLQTHHHKVSSPTTSTSTSSTSSPTREITTQNNLKIKKEELEFDDDDYDDPFDSHSLLSPYSLDTKLDSAVQNFQSIDDFMSTNTFTNGINSDSVQSLPNLNSLSFRSQDEVQDGGLIKNLNWELDSFSVIPRADVNGFEDIITLPEDQMI
ncbi:hypothetical protein WICMUC_001310 [Wickerhamomyces mucosus]|uniref:Zn(2)-C6 fungal-type domain-containing protein n=1 Tax=Wickerhamomyces mucosus TaxID=1378264 RepID=A0A9P8THX7_9ASCO|nr:hypothetical protein WICMUC_001310 [Wickerhamomyces mucosus]